MLWLCVLFYSTYLTKIKLYYVIILHFCSTYREEHKRLCPNCPFIQLGKPQNELNVKQVMELCQKSLIKYMVIMSVLYTFIGNLLLLFKIVGY